MKKITLSLLVIFAFTGFGLYQWLFPSQAVPLALPPSSPVESSSPANTTPGGSAPPQNPASTTPPQTPVTTTPTPPPVSNNPPPVATAPPPKKLGPYNDGTYTGSVADAYYGNIQVEAIIKNGQIADVKFLQYPSDRSTSRYINSQADPYLTQEAIQTQNANVNIISGATDSSMAFQQSLASALSQAQ